MPRAKDKLKITVVQETTGDERTVTVTIAAMAADFILPDLLSRQGAIDSYESRLISSARRATEDYLQEAQAAVDTLAERKQERQSSAPAASPKRSEAVKDAAPKREARLADLSEPPVSRGVPAERGNGPVRV